MIQADDFLSVPNFGDLSRSDRAWLADHFEEMILEEGEEMFEPGAPADNMIIVLSGSMQILFKRGGAWQLLDTLEPGRISGMLPYSRMKSFDGRGVACEPLRLALLHKKHFPEMLYRLPELGQPLIGLMSDRVRVSARADQEREKMLALGKLSAGLAHELNNPAAAVRRAADDLKQRLETLPAVVARLARHGLDPTKVNPDSGYCEFSSGKRLGTLELADREDELADWMEDKGVEDAFELAPTLAEVGIQVADLDRVVADLPDEAVSDVLRWIEQSLGANRLLAEIYASAERISELVSSVKSYSHMDRSDEKQPVQLAEGIHNTLTMLGHRVRKQSIIVDDQLGDLPKVSGYPGELNQVWTNLIDNALDAMGDGGTLTLQGRCFAGSVEVRLTDSGSGIPKDVVQKIFDPFFTTKGVGQGTGLGLEIAHRIICKQHQGRISVDSEPGRTTFTVALPMADGA
ncbi:MAG: signal transduction histidine kinase [Rhodothermales bacterium]|jgi:signal transduction histidine kinase